MVKFLTKTRNSWKLLKEEPSRKMIIKKGDSNLMLLNNRKQAIQRLMLLKKRFIKDNKFFRLSQVYGQSVKNFLCKKVRCIIIREDFDRYILHHGVYYPNKPGKICAVFDCSAEFQGRSINKELLNCYQDQV